MLGQKNARRKPKNLVAHVLSRKDHRRICLLSCLLLVFELMDQLSEKSRLKLEKDYVKCTYDNIADEFSGTRYKKWPKVQAFIDNLPVATLLLDVGCGNGKYLDNNSTINIGCDVSLSLLSICKKRGFEVVLCDMTRLPFRDHAFDAIICVAALHHIVTAKRRQECVGSMMNLIFNSSSRLFIQVWSYEQEIDKDNPYLKGNRLKDSNDDSSKKEICLEQTLNIPIHKNRTPFAQQDLLVPFNLKQKNEKSVINQQYLRYYHLFKAEELDSLINQTPNTKILESYYDRGNWCTVVGRI